jgi:uncharacterized protein
MDRLSINVAGLLQESTGSSRRFEFDDFLPAWEEISLVTPIGGVVEFCRAGKGIVVRSDLEAIIELTCCRCLEIYDQEVHVCFAEVYYPLYDLATGRSLRLEYDEIESEFLIENVDRLDLTEAVRQHVEVSQPLMPRCEQSCLGICPECGADRNSSMCACAEAKFDVRMAPIQEMLQQISQDHSV